MMPIMAKGAIYLYLLVGKRITIKKPMINAPNKKMACLRKKWYWGTLYLNTVDTLDEEKIIINPTILYIIIKINNHLSILLNSFFTNNTLYIVYHIPYLF